MGTESPPEKRNRFLVLHFVKSEAVAVDEEYMTCSSLASTSVRELSAKKSSLDPTGPVSVSKGKVREVKKQ